MNVREEVGALAARLQARTCDVQDACARAVQAGFLPGSLVAAPDGTVGEVRGLNVATFGFFTGDRYPLLVERDELVSEYAPSDGLRLIRAGDKVWVHGYRNQARGVVTRADGGELEVVNDDEDTHVFRINDIARLAFC